MNIVVNADRSANFTIEQEITNSSADKLIGGYEYVFPHPNPTEVSIKINDADVGHTINEVDKVNYSKINIDFSEHAVRPSETKKLVINAKVSNIIETIDSSSHLFIKSTQDTLSEVNFKIDKAIGSPKFMIPKNSLASESETIDMQFVNPSSILFVWGDKYDLFLASKVTFQNNSNKEVKSLFPLPFQSNSQKVQYGELTNSIYGLFNRNANFSVIKIDKNQEKEAEFKVKVMKSFGNLNIVENIGPRIELNKDNPFYPPLSEFINKEEDSFIKLEEVHNLLVNKYKLDQTEKAELKDMNEYWTKLSEKESFESFDYCFVLAGLANSIGLNFQISYGYIALPMRFGPELSPHFWCLASNGETTILMDPFMQKVTGLNYFGMENDFDRVVMGNWSPEEDFNDNLGLLDESEITQKIKFTDNFEPKVSTDVSFQTNLKGKEAYSGFFHTLEFKFDNKTSSYMPISKLVYKDRDFTDAGKLRENLQLAILPLQKSDVTLTRFRNYNFFEKGIKDVEIKLELMNEDVESLSRNIQISYIVNDKAIIGGVIGFNLVLGLITIFIYRRLSKQKVY